MTSDGVGGTAADDQAGAGLHDRAPGTPLIKRDDGRFAPRYIGVAYPHTPVGGVTPRRERQVAFALRNTTDLMIASLICGADGTAGRTGAEVRRRVRPPRRPAKGPR